jgi:LysR family nitrogen assimilation transcriptional regulator
VLHGIHSPRIMSELNLVWSSRRPSTETHKRALALIREVVQTAVGDWSALQSDADRT